MKSSLEHNSDIDDISINTNLKVFNGGLGLNTNKKVTNNNINSDKKNKVQKLKNNFQQEKGHMTSNSIYDNKNINKKIFNQINLEKDSLLETEGVISFRSKRVNKHENDNNNNNNNVQSNMTNITNGIINKLEKLAIKKDEHSMGNENGSMSPNTQEEMTINKIFKLKEEKEIEKEIKNFEKESQRFRSKIYGESRRSASSSEQSENFMQESSDYSNNNQKIRKILDDINLQNVNQSKRLNQLSRRNITNSSRRCYNTISGKENSENKFHNIKNNDDAGNAKVGEEEDLKSNRYSNSSNSETKENCEGNIFWTLKDLDVNTGVKRCKSTVYREYSSEKPKRLKKEDNEAQVSSFKCTLSKIEKGYSIFVTSDDFVMLLPSALLPRSLGIGDSFTFKISEGIKHNSRVNKIYDIQKKYTKPIGKII